MMRWWLALLLVPALPATAQEMAEHWTMWAGGQVPIAPMLASDAAKGWNTRMDRLHGIIDGGGARDVHGRMTPSDPLRAANSVPSPAGQEKQRADREVTDRKARP